MLFLKLRCSHLTHKTILNWSLTTLIMCVDDIIVTCDDNKEILGLKVYLAKKFEIKDLGSLSYFLGIKVARFR